MNRSHSRGEVTSPSSPLIWDTVQIDVAQNHCREVRDIHFPVVRVGPVGSIGSDPLAEGRDDPRCSRIMLHTISVIRSIRFRRHGPVLASFQVFFRKVIEDTVPGRYSKPDGCCAVNHYHTLSEPMIRVDGSQLLEAVLQLLDQIEEIHRAITGSRGLRRQKTIDRRNT